MAIFALLMLMERWGADLERLERDCAPSTASDQRVTKSPPTHLWMRDFTSPRISRQRKRRPAGGLARTHLVSMKSLVQRDPSPGSSVTEDRLSARTLAQRFLAPLGTCWRVGMEDWRMVDREGRPASGGEEGGGETRDSWRA